MSGTDQVQASQRGNLIGPRYKVEAGCGRDPDQAEAWRGGQGQDTGEPPP